MPYHANCIKPQVPESAQNTTNEVGNWQKPEKHFFVQHPCSLIFMLWLHTVNWQEWFCMSRHFKLDCRNKNWPKTEYCLRMAINIHRSGKVTNNNQCLTFSPEPTASHLQWTIISSTKSYNFWLIKGPPGWQHTKSIFARITENVIAFLSACICNCNIVIE